MKSHDKLNSLHIKSLTGLRGIFAIWVLGLHLVTGLMIDHIPVELLLPSWLISFFDIGYWGVDGFFILSGFILSYSYTQKLSDRLNFKIIFHYLWSRLARFYPVHLVILLLYVFIQVTGLHLIQQDCIPSAPSPIDCNASVAEIASGTKNCEIKTDITVFKCERFSSINFLKHFFLVSSWTNSVDLTWNFPSWSISSEWFAYLLFPFIIIYISRIRSAFSALSLAFFVLSIMTWRLAQLGYAPLGIDPEIGLIRVTGEFLCGCLIYRYYVSSSFKKMPSFYLGLVSTFLILFAKTLHTQWILPILLALVILSVAANNNIFSKLLSTKIMVWLGRISYSLYMSQLLTLELLGVIFNNSSTANTKVNATDIFIMLSFMTFSTISVATFFYYLIEEPSRKWMKKILAA